MKETKFRAWDEEKQYMIRNAIINFEGRIFDIQCEPEHEELTGKVVLMQFTGMKDKNNRRIYENDILKLNEYIDENIYDEIIKPIKFENGAFCFQSLPIYEYMDEEDNIELEIVGNIYENPELLK